MKRKKEGEKISFQSLIVGSSPKASAAAALQPLQIAEAVRRGVPFSTGRIIKEAMGVDDKRFASILGVSLRTLMRYKKKNDVLPETVSDRVARIARIMDLAVLVLGEEESASDWLNSPQYGLGDRVPLDLIDTDSGTYAVEQLLMQIDYGILP